MDSSHEKICDICHNNPPKYKCPQCEIRYCTVACFKSHRLQTPHDDTWSSKQKGPSGTLAISSISGISTTKPLKPPKIAAVLQSDQRFIQLMKQYPSLKSLLQRVYHMSLHHSEIPPALKARYDAEDEQRAKARLNKGGTELPRQYHKRKHFSGKMSGADAGGGSEIWTQAKADERAIAWMLDVMLRDEGMAEFMELSKLFWADRDIALENKVEKSEKVA